MTPSITLTRARAALDRIRATSKKVRADIAALHPGLRAEVRAAEADKLRAAARAAAKAEHDAVTAEVTAALATAAGMTRRAFLAGASFVPTLDAEKATPIRHEQLSLRLQAQATAAALETLWLTKAATLSETELPATFASAPASGQYAISGVVLREAERRAERSSTGTEEEIRASASMRAAVRQMTVALDAAEIPSVQAAEVAATELQAMQGWLRDAVDAIDSGDDASVRAEKLFALRQRNATNDEIRAAMSEQAAA